MRAEMLEYLENLKRIKDLSDFRLHDPGHAREQINAIRADSRAIYALQKRNNELLDTLFYSRDLSTLTAEEAEGWQEFAASLVDGYRQLDLGLAYRLHCMLLDWARMTGNREEELRQLYFCGLTLYYLETPLFSYKIKSVDPRIRAYFQAGMGFLEHFDQLSREGCAYVLRCAGNLRLGMNMPGKPWYFHQLVSKEDIPDPEAMLALWLDDFDKAYALITDPELRAMRPDLPWDDYLYSMHFGRTTLISSLRDGVGGRPLACLIYESACYIYQRQEQAARQKNIALPGRLVYVYAAAQYHMGLIGAAELMETLLRTAEQADPTEISAETTFRILGLSAYLRYYLPHCTPQEQERMRERVLRVVVSAAQYLSRLPRSDYFSQTTSYIRNLVELEIIDAEDEDAQGKRERLLRMMLLCHRPTYVHCMTVAWLSQRLVQRMLEVQPQFFLTEAAGVYRCDTIQQARGRQTELMSLAYDVGLYHDVGKIGILDVVSIYGRRLTPEEFRTIQYHPFIGYVMLMALGGMTLCAESALNHHRYYSDQGGYPREGSVESTGQCPLMTDVLAIADSLDAATDDVGRSYAQAKTLDELVQEMGRARDTRYAGYVLNLLEDDDFRAALESELTRIRQELYLYVYNMDDRIL